MKGILGVLAISLLLGGPAQAAEVYRVQIPSSGGSSVLPLPLPIAVDTSRQEWVIVTVDGPRVRIRHSTSIVNLMGFRNWYDHPAILIRVCLTDGFEVKNCRTSQGDVATLPAGRSIYDVSFDFKYVESGQTLTRTFQIARSLRSERQ